jgi:hypothetical protein
VAKYNSFSLSKVIIIRFLPKWGIKRKNLPFIRFGWKKNAIWWGIYPILGNLSERGRTRTFNQWLKRTMSEKRFFHPRAWQNHPIHWTIGEKNLLDFFIKGLSTRKQPMDLLHNDSEKDSDV